jgi:hypothetical protein
LAVFSQSTCGGLRARPPRRVGCTNSVSRRSGFVFVYESTEQFASSDRRPWCGGALLVGGVGRGSGACSRVRGAACARCNGGHRPGGGARAGAAEDQQPVEALPSCAADPALDVRVRVRRLEGRLITRIPSPGKIASKARLNFASRSWMRNRGRRPPSSRSISRLRACCSIRAPSGLLVQATYSTRRLPMQMKTSTYRRRSRTASTVKRSQASVVAACWRRNERHLGPSRCAPAGHRRTRARCARASPRRRSPACAARRRSARSPAAVLARQPQDQGAHLSVDRWPAGTPVRIRPMSGDEPPVPAQQRLRFHREGSPRATRHRPAERGQQQPIARRELRPPHLSPQDRQLVPQHEDLELLRALAAPEQHHQLEQTADEEVHHRHGQAQPPEDGKRRRYPDLSRSRRRAQSGAEPGLCTPRPTAHCCSRSGART